MRRGTEEGKAGVGEGVVEKVILGNSQPENFY